MVKAVKHSQIAKELKKEYLHEHLESVKNLIRSWMSGIHPPEPLAPNNRVWGWQSLYQSPRQDSPDDNHILRHHLKSRALWSHHSNWEQELEKIWQLTNKVRLEAEARKEKQSEKGLWRYTEDYSFLALWKAFDMALGKAIDLSFKVPDTKSGLSYGSYKIEESASSPEERMAIENEYKGFIRFLSNTSTMKQLVNSWQEASRLETQMYAIADKALKSNDILYTCSFCKHLWF